MNKKQHLNFNRNSLTISKLHNLNTMNKTQRTNNELVNTWKRLISNMTTEEIEKRSLLVSMSEKTDDNILFQQLLTNEYNNRKNNLTDRYGNTFKVDFKPITKIK